MSDSIIPAPLPDDDDCLISRAEYVARYLADHDLPGRYWKARKLERSVILDEAVIALCYHRKSLIRLFVRLRQGAGHAATRPGRTSVYSDAAKATLADLWDLMDRPSERKLKGSLPEWIDAMQRAGELDLSDSVTNELLCMSSATMGRIVRELRRPRSSVPRRARPHSRVQAGTPLRTWGEWKGVKPGEVQVDTVFHAGGIGGEGHLYTLAVIDPYSGWTDAQAIDSLTQKEVMPALDQLRRRAPFVWAAIHTDNGSEFLNRSMVNWCNTHEIGRTRGRPAKSGDQALIENANRRFIRYLAGDVRYEGAAARDALNELYAVARELVNFFTATTRLVEKKRSGRNVTRRYDEPRTPYRRLLESERLEQNPQRTLKAQFMKANPAALAREREKLRDRVWELRHRVERPR